MSKEMKNIKVEVVVKIKGTISYTDYDLAQYQVTEGIGSLEQAESGMLKAIRAARESVTTQINRQLEDAAEKETSDA